MDSHNALVVFEGKNIRRIFHSGEWFFVVVDIVSVLTDSVDASDYLKKVRLRDDELNKGWGQIVTPLSIPTAGGVQSMNCATTRGLFRIIQSIPSPKAEPFKQWLAQVGYERVQEIENPELAQKRMKEIYKLKGYSDEWIEKRVRGIAVRDELTSEWSKRGVKEGKEYAILTSEISKATFGVTPQEYRDLKGLQKENLRDHMNDLEIIFTMLGEASTTAIAKGKSAQGFGDNEIAAKEGGAIAGTARKNLEMKSGTPVMSGENYLKESESVKRKRLK